MTTGLNPLLFGPAESGAAVDNGGGTTPHSHTP
jgi:hypothetical protein